MSRIIHRNGTVEALTALDISCAESGCLSSIAWFGHPADKALAEFARGRGWAVFEASGWKCPHHQSEARP